MKFIYLVEKLFCITTDKSLEVENNVEELKFNMKTGKIKVLNRDMFITGILHKIEFSENYYFNLDLYEKVELVFIIYDKNKLSYQDYLSSEKKMHELFDAEHVSETDGILYLGRKSLNATH